MTQENFRVRDDIVKQLDLINLLNLSHTPVGVLKMKSTDFGFNGFVREFTEIINSIYKYQKLDEYGHFIVGKIVVQIELTSDTPPKTTS